MVKISRNRQVKSASYTSPFSVQATDSTSRFVRMKLRKWSSEEKVAIVLEGLKGGKIGS